VYKKLKYSQIFLWTCYIDRRYNRQISYSQLLKWTKFIVAKYNFFCPLFLMSTKVNEKMAQFVTHRFSTIVHIDLYYRFLQKSPNAFQKQIYIIFLWFVCS